MLREEFWAPASVWTVRTPDFSVSPGLLGDAHFHSIFWISVVSQTCDTCRSWLQGFHFSGVLFLDMWVALVSQYRRAACLSISKCRSAGYWAAALEISVSSRKWGSSAYELSTAVPWSVNSKPIFQLKVSNVKLGKPNHTRPHECIHGQVPTHSCKPESGMIIKILLHKFK